MMNMNSGLYMSINPNTSSKIEKEVKLYEFRNYIPKRKFDKLYVYVTSPVCELKYILLIDDIISYPNTIPENGDGNCEFNQGIKSKHAYQISKVYKLKKPILLDELKEKYGFVPPQGYAYSDRYNDLTKFIESTEKDLVWKK